MLSGDRSEGEGCWLGFDGEVGVEMHRGKAVKWEWGHEGGWEWVLEGGNGHEGRWNRESDGLKEAMAVTMRMDESENESLRVKGAASWVWERLRVKIG